MRPTCNSGTWVAACLLAGTLCLAACSTTKPSRAKTTPVPAADVVATPPQTQAPPLAPAPAVTPAPASNPDVIAPSPPPLTLTGGAPAVARAAAPPPPRILDKLFPQPPALDRDVNFWIRVYTEVGTNAGFLHDQYNLGVVYETIQFQPDTSARQREALVAAARARVVAALKRVATSTGPLSPEDQHIKDMWGPGYSPARILSAVEDVRLDRKSVV